LRLGVALVTLVTLAGCGGRSTPPPQLADGTDSPPLPAVLSGLDDAVMTRVRVARAAELDPALLRTCLFRSDVQLGGRSIVVERVGVVGWDVTFAYPGGPAFYACDAIPDSLPPDSDRPKGSPWCGGSYGRTVRRRLTDPRLHLCQARDGKLVGFVWVHAGRRARWVAVRDGDRREVYETAGAMPVRVTTTAGVDTATSSASFGIEEYGADGTRLRAYTLRASVAG